jgi:glutamate racemase
MSCRQQMTVRHNVSYASRKLRPLPQISRRHQVILTCMRWHNVNHKIAQMLIERLKLVTKAAQSVASWNFEMNKLSNS